MANKGVGDFSGFRGADSLDSPGLRAGVAHMPKIEIVGTKDASLPSST